MPMPDLQNEQRPKTLAQIQQPRAALLVAVPNFFDGGRLEVAAIEETLAEQKSFSQRAPLVAKPVAHRDAETHLLAREYFRRQERFHRFFKNELAAVVVKFPFGRQTGGQLDDAIIEQRRADFERMGHAHAVHFGQDVFRQIGFEVEGL